MAEKLTFDEKEAAFRDYAQAMAKTRERPANAWKRNGSFITTPQLLAALASSTDMPKASEAARFTIEQRGGCKVFWLSDEALHADWERHDITN